MITSVPAHIAFASQISLGIVFALSAWPKLRHPLAFAQNVKDYKVLPAPISHIFGLAVILVEVFLAIAMFTGWLTNVALPLAVGLLLTFLMGVSINLVRGRKIACGCFGDEREHISPRTLVRLILLLIAVLWIAAFRSAGIALLSRIDWLPIIGFSFAYLVIIASMSVFLLLLASWLLSTPELFYLMRRSR
jgi:hypothetical protein